jgi:hypothetical protein
LKINSGIGSGLGFLNLSKSIWRASGTGGLVSNAII